jgi:AraC-like DNA-binding protein
MRTLVTVSNALISAILDGIPVPEETKHRLVDEVGLDEEEVRDVTGRTPLLTLWRLWDRILAVTGDDHVGIEIGRSIRGDRFGLAAHAAQNSADLRQALRRFADYAALINDMIACRLEEGAEDARFVMKFHWDVLDLERHAVDITFVALVLWARERLGERLVLREVRFRHALGGAAPRCREIFAVPVSFGAERNEVVLDVASLDAPLGDANLELGQILERHARAELGKTPVLTDLPSRISQIIRRELAEGRRVDLAGVCRELRTTPRHLQRKLSEASTSFRELLDGARKSLAPSLLAEPSANVEQVAFRLGYADPTAFIRAFRKWFAMTPGEYRRSKSL